MTLAVFPLSFVSPIRLEYMSWWAFAALYIGLGAYIVFLGVRSLNGLGPQRKWVVIGIRLLVLLLVVLILAGVRFQREHEDMEVWVLRDVSGSTDLVEKRDYPGKSLQESIDDYLRAASKDPQKRPDDKIGVISFMDSPQVDAVPSTELRLDTRGTRDRGTGTDLASAIQLALASMSPDKRHRLVLIHDGNTTTGDTDSAIASAASQHVPIDVMPLHYDVQNAVLVEHFVSPTWKRENEPFVIDVILRSTGSNPVSGTLDVTHKTSGKDQYIEHNKPVTLQPGRNVVHVMVPALADPGVHRFVARFKPNDGALAAGGSVSADVDKINQPAEALTFVRGQGQVLYVDNYRDSNGNLGPGDRLEKALKDPVSPDARAVNKINVHTIDVEHFPQNLVELQNYDAVILGNVPRGAGGLSTDQDKMLAQYVHDMGGGLVMLGGDDTFGAGAWQNSEVEKILPVDMDIPAQRQVGKGALVLVMHSCEMPNGNFWGLECALQAIKTLSDHDEIGICSYDWTGANGGGAAWDYPLQEKGDGSAVNAAAHKMVLGDMPSFDDAMNVALNGTKGGGPAGQSGLLKSNARHKHVIIISDGDPQAPNQALVQAYQNAKISVSTVTVYPHSSGPNTPLPPVMEDIARQLKGKAYGPIESKPSQLPQIFIKEATIVRRTLLHENADGMAVKLLDASDPAAAAYRGLEPPPIFGLVLTSKKNDPKVSMPMAVGKMVDPVLADWQAGLGKSIVFTSDPTAKWGAAWIGSPQYDAFWGNVVRSVERPPMSEDFEVRTTVDGTKGKIAVEAVNKDDNFLNFLNIGGEVLGPTGAVSGVHLVQTGPGTYEANFEATEPGSYAVALNYHGAKQRGYLRGGVAVNSDPEYRDLKSNDGKLEEIAVKTAGRLLPEWDPAAANLFSRDNVPVSASPMPVWDRLIPFLLALILLDVAARRIAWDWASIRRTALAMGNRVRSFTSVRKVETRGSLDALRQIKQDSAESRARPGAAPQAAPRPPAIPAPRPDPKAKFEAKAKVEGDISQLVGGASDKPIPAAPKKIEPKGAPAKPGSHTGSLLEAKRRAQEQIKKKEDDGK